MTPVYQYVIFVHPHSLAVTSAGLFQAGEPIVTYPTGPRSSAHKQLVVAILKSHLEAVKTLDSNEWRWLTPVWNKFD